MKYLMILVLTLVATATLSPTVAEAHECYGCSCTTECWRNGVCREVCRDSCGHFCFAGGDAVPEALNYTPFDPKDTDRPGMAPTGFQCPSSYPIKGNFTTYDGSRCIAHRPGGNSYNRTRHERCYATMEDAVADGCRPAKR